MMQYVVFIFVYVLFTTIQSNFLNTYEKHLASKTPYRVIRNNNDTPINFEGCTPIKIWYIIRHGTRTPTTENVQQMKERLPVIQQLIIQANEQNSALDIEGLKKWKLLFDDNCVLSPEGAQEMVLLAKRMQARFPHLFPQNYTKSLFSFKYTDTERTMKSASNFILGLFGNYDSDVYFPKPIVYDPILRFYKSCTRWKKEVDQNVSPEQELFHKSDTMTKAITLLHHLLNLNGSLTISDAVLMYDICGFELAIFKKSVWCSLIPFETLKALEFSDSLHSYYRNGYAEEVTYKQACPLFNYMVNHFNSTEAQTTTVLFSHDGTILKFYAHLGLFEDKNGLKHTDYGNSYKWITSKIGTFATNIAFVLYRCSGKLKVAVLVNEQIVQLPKCGELCDFDDIKMHYNESINNCVFEQICNNTST